MTKVNTDAKKFKKFLKSELGTVRKEYEEAKKHYEKSMKAFIVKNISGRKNFKEMYEFAYSWTSDYDSDQDAVETMKNITTLNRMIFDFIYWLEEEQFECDELVN